MGYYITGSDNNPGDTIDFEREKLGVPVTIGQRAENIEGADLIVHTAAIMDDNPELMAARASLWVEASRRGLAPSKSDNPYWTSSPEGPRAKFDAQFELGEHWTPFLPGKLLQED